MKKEHIEVIAIAVHAAMAPIQKELGMEVSDTWEGVPNDQKEALRANVEHIVDNPNASEAVLHNTWLEQAVADGWRPGRLLDTKNKISPAIVNYMLLPEEYQKPYQVMFGTIREIERKIRKEMAETTEQEQPSGETTGTETPVENTPETPTENTGADPQDENTPPAQ